MAKVEITGIHLTHGSSLSYKLSITREEISSFLETGEEPDALSEFFQNLLDADTAIGTVEIIEDED